MNRRRFLGNCSLLALGYSQSAFAADGFQPLFDGKSLHGWHKPAKPIAHGTGGIWEVNNGMLTGEQDPPGSGNGGLLLSDKKFGDFELEIDLNPDWGPDTGVFFRCTEEGHGFQMYVDYYDGGNVGHLRGEMPGAFAIKPFQIFGKMDANGRPTDFRSEPDARALKWPKNVYEHSCTFEEWKKAWKKDDWNRARIRCVGKHPQITTWINDLKICHWDGEKCPLPEYDKERVFRILGREGSIGLQVHRGKAWPEGKKCRWRNIRIKEL